MNWVTSRDGTPIAYERSGEGPPVILVGGALTDRQAAATLAAELAPHFTAVAYDRRGRGASGDTPPYAVEREVDDLGGLVAELGGWAFVCGFSAGAALALEAAASGLAIRKLAVFEPPFRVGGSPAASQRYMTRLTELTSSGRRAEAVEFFLLDAVGLPAEAVAWMRRAPTWQALEAMAHTLVYDGLIAGYGELPAERLAAVTVPTLAIESRASPPWLRRAAQAVADILPRAEHRTLEGGFHQVAPRTLAPVLKSFFTG